MQAFKAMMRRETTLIQRTFFVYIFKAVQVRPYTSNPAPCTPHVIQTLHLKP